MEKQVGLDSHSDKHFRVIFVRNTARNGRLFTEAQCAYSETLLAIADKPYFDDRILTLARDMGFKVVFI